MALNRRLAAIAAASVLGAAPAEAAASCQALATLPLRDVAGYLLVAADLGGIPVSLLVDTGSDAGLIDAGVVHALGLRPGKFGLATPFGTGGAARPTPVAVIPRMVLGDLAVRDVPMPIGRLPAAPRVSPPVAGLLGADLLSQFGLRIDVPDGTLALLPDIAPCDEAALTPGSADTVPLERSGDRLLLRAVLDGRPVTALVDTGARSRIVSRRAAMAVGVAPALLDAEPGGVAAGVDGHDAIYHWHRFRTLAIGNDMERGPVLTVMPLAGSGADMLLGADWFERRRVVVSYATARMLVQRAFVTR